MPGLPYAKNFRELEVYKRTRELANLVFEVSKAFPREEMYSLTDQVRRASRSIGGQIAESWAKRRYPKHFVSKLTDADGEQNETQHWIETAHDCAYINGAQRDELINLCLEIGKMLGAMMHRAEEFSGNGITVVNEDPRQYTSGSPGAGGFGTDH